MISLCRTTAVGAICILALGDLHAVADATVLRVPSQQPSIQEGIDAAALGDTVLVAPGIYTGGYNTCLSFYGTDRVLLSEAGAEATIIDCEGWLGPNQGFRFEHGETAAAVVDGFTIRNGDLDYGGGAGIMVTGNAAPTIRNCILVDNWVASAFNSVRGGGMLIEWGAAPTIENCTFLRNGAVFLGPPPGYSATGGALQCINSAATLIECTFIENSAAGAHIGSTYWDGYGGAIHSSQSTLAVHNCTFHANRAALSGSGLHVWGPTTVENTIIAFGQDSEAIYAEYPEQISIACTNIFGNADGDWVGAIAGQYGINGNISEDPLFCNAPAGDFTLDAASPCAPEHSGGCGLIGAWPVGCGTVAVAEHAVPSSRLRLTVSPNPVLHGATFTFAPSARPLSLEIYDPTGRLLERLRPSGTVMWTPSDRAARGVYFARLKGEGGSETVKFVVLR